MSEGGIGGNLSTSIIFDVSGIRTGTQIAARELQTLEGAVARTSAAFVESSDNTSAAAESLQRAAEMVELLSVKMLSFQSTMEKTRQSTRAFTTDVNAISAGGRSLTEMMMGGSLGAAEMQRKAEQEEKENTKRLAAQQQWVIDRAKLLELEKEIADRARAEELTALRVDIERRSRLRREWFQRQRAESNEFRRNDPMSYLGSRRGGFAAQQLAYGVEDFAQVYGTMGLAGGLRAASNNLTAMASTLGPTVGVMASLAAAAGLMGLHLWEAHKATSENKKAEEDWLAIRQKILGTFSAEIDSQRQLIGLRKASVSGLMSGIDLIQQQTDKRRQEAQVSEIDLLKSQIEARGGKVDDLNSGAWTALFEGLWLGGAGVASSKVLETYRFNVDQMNLQQKISFLTTQEQMKIKERLSNERILKELLEARNTIMARTVEMLNEEEKKKQTINELQAHYLIAMQTRFAAEDAEAERMRMVVDLAERILELQKEGKKAAEDAAAAINARFAGLNEEFAFEQQILETRKKIREEIDLAVRAGKLNEEQAGRLQDDLRRVIMLERERREAQEAITEAEERQKEIRKQLVNPAGLTGAIRFGSQEAIQVLEQERLRKLAVDENKPVVEELRRLLNEIKAQKAILEKIAQERPAGAVLEGF